MMCDPIVVRKSAADKGIDIKPCGCIFQFSQRTMSQVAKSWLIFAVLQTDLTEVLNECQLKVAAAYNVSTSIVHDAYYQQSGEHLHTICSILQHASIDTQWCSNSQLHLPHMRNCTYHKAAIDSAIQEHLAIV